MELQKREEVVNGLLKKVKGNLSKSNNDLSSFEETVKELESLLSSSKAEINRQHYQYQTLVNHTTFGIEELLNKVKDLPESNGSRYYRQSDLKVGYVGSSAFINKFKNIPAFLPINMEDIKTFDVPFDALLIVPDTKDLKEAEYQLALGEFIQFHKNNHVPVIFYGMNDPMDFTETLPMAQQADYIFTHDVDKLYEYKENCGQAKAIEYLPSPFNPVVYNPIGSRDKVKSQILYVEGWDEKVAKHLNLLFKTVLESMQNLVIFDDSTLNGETVTNYPKRYFSNIINTQFSQQLNKLYKVFDFVISFSSNMVSQSAFSHRINEISASGAGVLSNYQPGVYSKYPNILIAGHKLDSIKTLNQLTDLEKYELQMEGVRSVYKNSTIHEFLIKIEKLIMQQPLTEDEQPVLVVANRINDKTLANFDRQTYKNKSLVALDKLTAKALKSHTIVVYFNDEYEYGNFYIQDLVNGFKYTDCSYITKDSYFRSGDLVKGFEHNYIGQMKDKYKSAFWVEDFNAEAFFNLEQLEGVTGYSIDPLELDVKPMSTISSSQQSKPYKMSVIVPIYNNGRHLLFKSFPSLKKSSMFDEMEIILVDDGSTNPETSLIVERLGRQYSNVKTHLFNDGGSGSASRPRNKATEMATADWIVYLDPDDEMINDGFAKLYRKVENTSYDMAIGQKLTLRNQRLSSFSVKKLFKKNIYLDSNNEERLTEDALSKSAYKPSSLSTLIINRKWLKGLGIEQIQGCFGQDSLFYQQVISHTTKVGFVDVPVYLYYGEVDGSAVNKINKKYFEKYITLENHRIKWLLESGLFEDYKERRFEDYFINWYLKKLDIVIPEDREASIGYLLDIIDLYGEITFSKKETLSFLENSKALVTQI